MKTKSGFFEELIPHFREDHSAWESWKKSFFASSAGEFQNFFWYLSSGMDVMPLYLFGGNNHSAGFPQVDLFIYSDFGVVFNTPEILKANTDKGYPEPLPAGRGSFYLTRLIPLHWNKDNNSKELYSEGRISASAFQGAPVYLLLIRNSSPEGDSPQIPVLFVRRSNRDMLRFFLEKELLFRYICTVTDGCRPDSRDTCPNNFLHSYLQVLSGDGFWITDHFNGFVPRELRKVAEFAGWGHYDTHDKSYCFSRK